MKAYKPLQDAFRKLDQSTVSWCNSVRFPKTAETANSVFHRDAVVDASTLAYMAHCLDMTNVQIVSVLDAYAKEVPKKAAEVAALKKLINPVDLSTGEQNLINRFRSLDDSSRNLILDLLNKLGGKP